MHVKNVFKKSYKKSANNFEELFTKFLANIELCKTIFFLNVAKLVLNFLRMGKKAKICLQNGQKTVYN